MTTLSKVTFTSTSGEETTGKAQYDHAAGLVTLPGSFQHRSRPDRNAS